jgi:hypothetical protein
MSVPATLPPAPTLGYSDLAVYKLYLDKQKSDEDDFLTRILAAAESVVETYTRHQWHPEPALDDTGADTGDPVTKVYSTHLRPRTRIRDLRVLTKITFGQLALDPALSQVDLGDYSSVQPATSIYIPFVTMRLYPMVWGFGIPGVNDLVVEGRWGWLPVPGDILDATYALAARMRKEMDANYADSVVAIEGVMLRYTRQLPARVQSTLDTWKIPNLALV